MPDIHKLPLEKSPPETLLIETALIPILVQPAHAGSQGQGNSLAN